VSALKTLMNQSSEIGDERPIVGCAFSPDGTQLATGAWSGTLKVMPVSFFILVLLEAAGRGVPHAHNV
jgi:WD40 repeat protein